KTKAAFSSKPKKNISLNLKKIKERFKDVIIDTPILLVIKVEKEEIVVHNYGEILFKTCKDMDKMKRIADQIYSTK
ncbi:hypothetical protein KY335_01485, partial [Candidatus Woesearchaeota archaeon]|nr:hypothetical protein [Candidatus Woesearchaeota archaeon]